MDVVIYPLADCLYINLTNRCTCRCQFCPLALKEPLTVQGFDLKLSEEPTTEAILKEIANYEQKFSRPKEIVFCGYGEPTLRLKELKEIARALKKKNYFIRLNTNGHANWIHKRNVAPELNGLIDEVRVSLNACDATEYRELNQPLSPKNLYPCVKEFIVACKNQIPKVIVSAVALSTLNQTRFQKIAHKELEVSVLFRDLDQQGVPQRVLPISSSVK